MKSKWIWFVGILIVVIIIVSGILVIRHYFENSIQKKDVIKKEIAGLKLEELPENYTEEQAIADGCFVIKNTGDVYNSAKLEAFLENTSINNKNRKEETLRIVKYTTEGDKIIIELSFHIQDKTYTVRNRNGK